MVARLLLCSLGCRLAAADAACSVASAHPHRTPQIGRENPAELKAAKLARSLTRGLVDRDLKPNSDERRAIAAVLRLPPNRPLAGEERALLWRYRHVLVLGCGRLGLAWVLALSPVCPGSVIISPMLHLLALHRYSLRGDKRALTKFLKCVDWSDAQEARQVRCASSRLHLVGLRARASLHTGKLMGLTPSPPPRCC